MAVPQVEWPQEEQAYAHRAMRILTQLGQAVLQWMNLVKDIFIAKVMTAHTMTKQSASSCRHQRSVDVQ
jgi:hypothetical protein